MVVPLFRVRAIVLCPNNLQPLKVLPLFGQVSDEGLTSNSQNPIKKGKLVYLVPTLHVYSVWSLLFIYFS